MRGAAQKPAAQQQFLLYKACTEEDLTFPQAQVVRISRKRWRVPNTLRNESPPYNHQSPIWHKSLQHPIER